jgi:hypothetical protein
MKMPPKNLPTIELLRDRLTYDSSTGVFTFRKTSGRAVAGKVAGCNHQHNDSPHLWYQVIGIEKQYYKAHRLAWFFVYGVDPGAQEIDHIDGNGLNNAITNLRICTSSQNNQNRRRRLDNSSGFNGVDYVKRSKKFRARICKDGKLTHIGMFQTAEEAFAAHEAARSSMFDNSHGRHRSH